MKNNHLRLTFPGFRKLVPLLVASVALVVLALSTAAPAHADGTVENCSDDSALSSVLLAVAL